MYLLCGQRKFYVFLIIHFFASKCFDLKNDVMSTCSVDTQIT